MRVKGGKALYGASVGILMLDAQFPRIIGDMGNAQTWPFPVHYKIVRQASPDKVVSTLESVKGFRCPGNRIRQFPVAFPQKTSMTPIRCWTSASSLRCGIVDVQAIQPQLAHQSGQVIWIWLPALRYVQQVLRFLRAPFAPSHEPHRILPAKRSHDRPTTDP